MSFVALYLKHIAICVAFGLLYYKSCACNSDGVSRVLREYIYKKFGGLFQTKHLFQAAACD